MIGFFRKLFSNKSSNDLKLSKDIIYVLGDSHSRSFSLNENFFPIFMGAGKENNFISDKTAKTVKTRIIRALKNVDSKYILLFLAEPDTRYYLGKGWYPWENKIEMEVEDFRPLADMSVKRYIEMVRQLNKSFPNQKFMILNVPPVIRKEQNDIVNYMNAELRIKSKDNDIDFIEFNDIIYKEDGITLKEEFVGDQVHLGTAIQFPVEEILIDKGILTKHGYNKERIESNVDFDSKYKFDKRFGCYVLQD